MEPFSSLSMRRFELLLNEVKNEDLSQPGIMPVVHSAGMAAIFDQRGDIEWAFALNTDPNWEPPKLERKFHSGFIGDDGQPHEIWITRSTYTNTNDVGGCRETHKKFSDWYNTYRHESKKAHIAAMGALEKCASEHLWENVEPLKQAIEALAKTIEKEQKCLEWVERQEYELAQLMDIRKLPLDSIDWIAIQFADAEEEESHPGGGW